MGVQNAKMGATDVTGDGVCYWDDCAVPILAVLVRAQAAPAVSLLSARILRVVEPFADRQYELG